MSTPPSSTHSNHEPDHELEAVSNCLFCKSISFQVECEAVRDLFFAADDGLFTYLRCENCQSLWLSSRPVGARLLRAYSAYYTHATPQPHIHRGGLRGILRSSYVKSRFAASSSMFDAIISKAAQSIGRDNSNIDEQYRFAPKAPAKILDYGCGSGEYLLRMEPFGHKLQGVEYDPQLLAELSRRGIGIENVATIQDDRWHAEFDHITLAHVLEHVASPDALLKRLFRWLKPGGSLFIEVPNAEATGLQIFGSYWRGLEAPRHFSLPSKAATVAALARAGFTMERQHINNTARQRVWGISLGAVPPETRSTFESAMASAPTETETNAEFLTFVARRPA
jgi:2-polyprenyl-3-methyl-5-hydroxy-6-metoxy-1,4-benzoquinol methylase